MLTQVFYLETGFLLLGDLCNHLAIKSSCPEVESVIFSGQSVGCLKNAKDFNVINGQAPIFPRSKDVNILFYSAPITNCMLRSESVSNGNETKSVRQPMRL